MLCPIWYHLYNYKDVKNTHGGVLLLVKLKAKRKILALRSYIVDLNFVTV